MERTIVALRGVANVGKSETICRVYEDLRREGRCIAPGRRTRKEVKGAIWEIDGVKVGFLSVGDKPWLLEQLLKDLIEAGCIIVVCATHASRSRTVEVVKRLASQAEPPFKVVWIEKHADADPDSGNRQKAEEIKRAVRDAIEEAQLAEAQLLQA